MCTDRNDVGDHIDIPKTIGKSVKKNVKKIAKKKGKKGKKGKEREVDGGVQMDGIIEEGQGEGEGENQVGNEIIERDISKFFFIFPRKDIFLFLFLSSSFSVS